MVQSPILLRLLVYYTWPGQVLFFIRQFTGALRAGQPRPETAWVELDIKCLGD